MCQIALELLVFQEKNYGRGCQEQIQGMMVPMSFFYDFEPDGGFSKIITQVRLYCLKESIKDNELELDKKENVERGHQIFKMVSSLSSISLIAIVIQGPTFTETEK